MIWVPRRYWNKSLLLGLMLWRRKTATSHPYCFGEGSFPLEQNEQNFWKTPDSTSFLDTTLVWFLMGLWFSCKDCGWEDPCEAMRSVSECYAYESLFKARDCEWVQDCKYSNEVYASVLVLTCVGLGMWIYCRPSILVWVEEDCLFASRVCLWPNDHNIEIIARLIISWTVTLYCLLKTNENIIA